MRPKLTKEQTDALAHSAGEPIECEDEESRIFLLVAREEFRGQERRLLDDPERLKEAILSRRDASRELNAEWEHADREVSDSPSSQ